MMKLLSRWALIASLCLAPLVFADIQAGTLVGADNPQIQYTGRVDFTEPKAPSISWPGTSIQLTFEGTSVAVILDDQHGANYFSAFIDGDYEKPVVLKLMQGEHTYHIAKELTDGRHQLTLYKRTEGEEGRTAFKGLWLDANKSLGEPPVRPTRRIAFFGDSITSGMGNEAPIDEGDAELAEKNNFLAYGAITARALQAEHHTVSQSGIGIMVSWFDFIMPNFYDQLDAVGDNDSTWDFTQWTPDVVVVNLFQNDSWLVEKKRLTPIPTDAQRVDAYYQFIKALRGKYPQATFVCALGSMDATQLGSPWPGYIEQAVAKINKEFSAPTYTFFFPFKDFGKHPRVIHHQENARALTTFIADKMQW